jgi:hypothetical protein
MPHALSSILILALLRASVRIAEMNSRFLSASLLFLLLPCAVPCWGAEEAPAVAHYYDEVGQRHLAIQSLGGTRVSVSLRWAMDPGSAGTWAGNGERRDNQILFAATVDEGQDRGAFFVTKGGESKLEVSFRPGQKMPQDPGILGVYRRASDEKRLQLLRKEAQAADDRLAAASKNASRTWPAADKPVAADWKSNWPALRERWMKIAYQPPEPAKPKPGVLMPAPAKGALSDKDPDYWLKLAQATALGYFFMQTPPDGANTGAWDGDYDDGLGGRVSIRQSKDGKLRVNLSCTRVGDMQAADLSGEVPPQAVKSKSGEHSAEAVFMEPEVPADAKEVRVTLRRKGGFLWVQTSRKASPPGSFAWFDGIYRWMPAPVE